MADISKIQIQNGVYDIKDTTARQSISDLNTSVDTRINNLSNSLLTDLVVIGDSYTALSGSTWAEDLADLLHLTLHKHATSSMGFVHQSGGNTFEDLLDWADTSFYNKVKYLICYGGINDYDIQRAPMQAGVEAFIQKAKNNFPNAQIIIVGPQVDAGQFSSMKVQKERVAMERACSNQGVAYVDASNWLINSTYNYTETYATDHLHPSALGYKLITSKMLGVINNQCNSDIKLMLSFNAPYTGSIRINNKKDGIHFTSRITGDFVQGAYNIPIKIEDSILGGNVNLDGFVDDRVYYPAYKIDSNNNVTDFVGCARIGKSGSTGIYGLYLVPLVANFTGTIVISGDIYLGNWNDATSAQY